MGAVARRCEELTGDQWSTSTRCTGWDVCALVAHLCPAPGGFGKRLNRNGLTVRGGRNTALIGLAGELPAAVLADLPAIDVVSATRRARYAKRDWDDYLATRNRDAH